MLEIVRILMDYEKDPAGVEEMPQFNWELKSDKRGVVQKAYQLQIAENRDFDTPVYDSGVTESCESAHIRPLHVELKSAVNYGVRVRVWAGAGDVLHAALAECEESAWCEGSFVTALLSSEEWKAPFVSAESAPACREESKGTLVRGSFSVGSGLKEAYAFTTALGLYHFYLNGEKVGEDEMTPGWTSYRRHLLYQTYDVTRCLREGVNTAGAMVGAGWYKGVMGLTRSRNNYGDQTAFAMQLVLRYEDGREETVCTETVGRGRTSRWYFLKYTTGKRMTPLWSFRVGAGLTGMPQIIRPAAGMPWKPSRLTPRSCTHRAAPESG